jgi:hypothetical protein
MMRMVLHLCALPPKTYITSTIMTRMSHKFHLKVIPKTMPNNYSSKLSSHKKKRKSEKPSLPKGPHGDMASKCNEINKRGPGTKKGH